MPKINSKNKGSSFEREVAKKLSLFLTYNLKDDTVWRSINSGAYSTVRNKKGLSTSNQEGDLTSISEESKIFFDKYCIECKRYKYVDLYNLFTENSEINKWWTKLQLESNTKIPFLIFKPDRKLIYCIIPTDIFNKINTIEIDHINISINKESICMFLFTDFIKLDKKIIEEI